MTNLVWDDSRIDELSELVHNTVVHFLEEFSVDVDAFKVAHETQVACRESLIEALTDGKDRFEVFNLDTDESHGVYDTLEEARGAVRYDKLRAYSIWLTVCGERDTRLDHCDPYDGDDDRIKQSLGMPNASEAL